MGTLEIIMGPMFSGKTELLIQKYNILNPDKNNPNTALAFNYYKDTRYGENCIASHNGLVIVSINIKTISEIFTDHKYFNKFSHILINEAQFFPDLKNSVIELVEKYNKHVIICGLDSDFKREKFGDIWDLIPYADIIQKLKGKCNFCNNDSLFTHRLCNQQEQEIIGNNIYIPVCRKCYGKTN